MKPKIITFLSPKGGAGRTTAVMALASTLVEEKGFPPLVIDATPEARLRPSRDTTLGQWQRQMHRSGVKRDQLLVRHAGDPDECAEIIEAHVGKRFPDAGTVLIDTGGQLDDLALSAAAQSDLLIAPFMNAQTALRTSEALDGVDLGDTPIYGLRCGDACHEDEQRAVSAAFTAGRLFVHGIPPSPQLADISADGHLFTTYISLACKQSETPLSTATRDFIKVRSEIGQLLEEIRLALQGYELRRRSPRPRQNPLPLHKLVELSPT